MQPEGEGIDDEFYVQRCVHVNYEDDATGVEVDVDVHWMAGAAPEVIKAAVDKAVEKAKMEVAYLA
jgi:hypothetical protein